MKSMIKMFFWTAVLFTLHYVLPYGTEEMQAARMDHAVVQWLVSLFF